MTATSERVQARIDQLLSEAEAAADVSNWERVRRSCEAVLDLDPGNVAANDYLQAMRNWQRRTHGVATGDIPIPSAPAYEVEEEPHRAPPRPRGASPMSHVNIVRRVTLKGGWVGVFSGESQGKALERVIPLMNDEGYRVAFIVEDKWNLGKRLLALVVFVFTLGIYGLKQNLLIIGERIPEAAVGDL